MIRQKAIAFAAAAVLSAVVLFCIAGADAAAAPDPEPEPEPETYSFYGYVATIDQEDNKPLPGVVVRLYDINKEEIDVCTTDEDGRFEFSVEDYTTDKAHFITLEYSEYAVRAHPTMSSTGEADDDDFFPFTLDSSKLDAEGKYALTGTADSRSSIIMAITVGDVFGRVFGDVSGETEGLRGAKVTLTSASSGKNYSTVTDEDGYFNIKCPYGQYTLSVTCNGFNSYKMENVSTGEGLAYDIDLVKVKSNVFFGLDNAHSMMVIGFGILIVMLVATIWLAKWSRKPNSPVQIDADLEPIETDEDDLKGL